MEMLRQQRYFDPHNHKNIPIDIIGLGAVGSYVAWFLSKTGMKNLSFWDHDKIEDHNIPNQCFLEEHTNMLKVQAAGMMTKLGSGLTPKENKKKVKKGGSFRFGKIVFLLVDSMKARKEIWDEFLKFKLATELVVETRMGVDSCRVYSINPCNQNHIDKWEKTLYTDEESSESLCGAAESIVTMASMTASMAVTQMIKWLKGGDVENEVIVGTDPMYNLILNHY
jgi:hypothetical protein